MKLKLAVITIVLLALVLACSARAFRATTERLDAAEKQLDAAERQRNEAERQLSVASRQLSDADRIATATISTLFNRQGGILHLLAGQAEPRSEWSFLLNEFQTSSSQFLSNDRNREVFPSESALAHLSLGQVLALRGDNVAATASIKECIRLSTLPRDRATRGAALNSLGCMYALLGELTPARSAFRESRRDLSSVKGKEILLAIVLRNTGLVERALGHDGAELVGEAIAILERLPNSRTIGVTSEFLQDFRMTLCEMYWAQGRLRQASELARRTHGDLQARLSELDQMAVSKLQYARNRYADAINYVGRNLNELTKALDAEDLSPDTLCTTASRWQWQRLVNNTTDLVSNDLAMTGTMVGEFERQNGVVLAWGMFAWTHDVALKIADSLYDRTQLVIVVDNEFSLQEAQASLEDAGVPIDRIRFRMADVESPWMRDSGPIVSVSAAGAEIWFDSRLTRGHCDDRIALDALPRTIGRDWRARVADVPIRVEGGMILSNGRGVAIVSGAAVVENKAYGFSEQVIIRELRRITGADDLLFVDWLQDEKTHHVDLFATFVSPSTVVVGEFAGQENPNAARLDDLAERLGGVEVDGKPLQVVRIPMPDSTGTSYPTFTNVVFANGVLLVPTYAGEPKQLEPQVRALYEELLPSWKVEFIDCTRLCAQGGALHCMVSNLGSTEFTPMHPRVNRE
jgi:agmatine/peptidylarginine deiminase